MTLSREDRFVGCLLAVNLGDHYGAPGILAAWLERLAMAGVIRQAALRLLP